MAPLMGLLFFTLTIFTDIHAKDRQEVTFTNIPCKSEPELNIFEPVHGDQTRYQQCGPAGYYWILPCAPGTVFRANHQACVPQDSLNSVTSTQGPVYPFPNKGSKNVLPPYYEPKHNLVYPYAPPKDEVPNPYYSNTGEQFPTYQMPEYGVEATPYYPPSDNTFSAANQTNPEQISPYLSQYPFPNELVSNANYSGYLAASQFQYLGVTSGYGNANPDPWNNGGNLPPLVLNQADNRPQNAVLSSYTAPPIYAQPLYSSDSEYGNSWPPAPVYGTRPTETPMSSHDKISPHEIPVNPGHWEEIPPQSPAEQVFVNPAGSYYESQENQAYSVQYPDSDYLPIPQPLPSTSDARIYTYPDAVEETGSIYGLQYPEPALIPQPSAYSSSVNAISLPDYIVVRTDKNLTSDDIPWYVRAQESQSEAPYPYPTNGAKSPSRGEDQAENELPTGYGYVRPGQAIYSPSNNPKPKGVQVPTGLPFMSVWKGMPYNPWGRDSADNKQLPTSPKENEKCSLANGPGSQLWPDPMGNRNLFFLCAPPSGNSWNPVEPTVGHWLKMKCPEGTYFEPKNSMCLKWRPSSSSQTKGKKESR